MKKWKRVRDMTGFWGTLARTAWQVDVGSTYLHVTSRLQEYNENLLMKLWRRDVGVSAAISLVTLTVSKTFMRLIAIAIARRGRGLGSLKSC